MRVMGGLVAMIAIVSAVACVYADGQPRPAIAKTTAQAAPNFIQTGRATYYHKTLRGMRTASGERYDPNAMTAAHRRLKLGTQVRVTHLRSKRSVIVRVNDRLPAKSRAIIDLSTLAARKLGMLHSGIAKVKIEALTAAEFAALENSR